MRYLVMTIIAVVLCWMVAGCDDDNDDGYGCAAQGDCVPEQCCHPTSCVSKANAPDCAGVACTEECAPNTMDCGQGYCDCIDDKCEAVFQN